MSTDEMFLSAGKIKMQLPVLPESLDYTYSTSTASIGLANVGEIVRLNGRKPITISFSSQFPGTAFQGSIKNPKSPKNYVDQIKTWINNKTLAKFVFTRSSSRHLGFVMTVLITDFKCTEKGGDVGTIQYSITLKEYRNVTVNQIKKNKKKTATKRTSTKTTSKTYTIKKNDTLWDIARRELGNSSKWKSIYDINKSTIENAAKKHGRKSSQTGHWIYPGTVLKLPSS